MTGRCTDNTDDESTEEKEILSEIEPVFNTSTKIKLEEVVQNPIPLGKSHEYWLNK